MRNRESTPRSDTSNPAPAYKLEVEIAPKQWHRQNIEKVLDFSKKLKKFLYV